MVPTSLSYNPINSQQALSTGKFIVSGSTDNTVIVWDAKTKEELCVYTCLSRITALGCGPRQGFAVGDGAGAFYVFKPIGLATPADDKKDNNKTQL